jgi:alpha-L-fucosidase
MSDAKGPLRGVPYDGTDPQNADLYHSHADPHEITDHLDWDESGIPESWKAHWTERITDLIDQAQPDYLYSDGAIPFGQRGLRMAAYLYNLSARRNGGSTQAIRHLLLHSKDHPLERAGIRTEMKDAPLSFNNFRD